MSLRTETLHGRGTEAPTATGRRGGWPLIAAEVLIAAVAILLAVGGISLLFRPSNATTGAGVGTLPAITATPGQMWREVAREFAAAERSRQAVNWDAINELRHRGLRAAERSSASSDGSGQMSSASEIRATKIAAGRALTQAYAGQGGDGAGR